MLIQALNPFRRLKVPYTKRLSVLLRLLLVGLLMSMPIWPQDVIIFVVGGTTYEESRSVSLQNASNSGIRFILGGSAILNSKRFLKDLEEAQRTAKYSTNVV
ncbi:hypothetical protein Patl1_08135 [Pistacia atlantica]|uniref:Uncharacterized protein n=1 Tax=Pistacia atlantica TaxID=434234 RepID=A0ACC1AHB9_9ROSI|nr:hypothetical protein Patl1_08135 [Pistacia atlantica]